MDSTTAFNRKLADYRSGQRTGTDPGYKRAVWSLLIAAGGASRYETDHRTGDDFWATRRLAGEYSETVETDLDHTLAFIPKIQAGLIDYDASDDPTEHHGPIFYGTFADSHGSFPYLAGRLRFTDGTWTWWAVKVGGDGADFGAVVRAITALNLTDAEAIEHLEARVTDPHNDQYQFPYDCTLPEM